MWSGQHSLSTLPCPQGLEGLPYLGAAFLPSNVTQGRAGGWEGVREAPSFLVGVRPAGKHVFGGVCVCEREVTLKPHCRPDRLAAKDRVWPLWWPQPQSLKDLEKKAQSEEKTDPDPAAALARGLAPGDF